MPKVLQVFKPKFRKDEILAEIAECLDKAWTGMGYKTDLFEQEWKKYSGFNNAHFLNSATSGLHLAINIFKNKYGWKDGDEVITTALTFVSTNHAILYERMTPVFADVDHSLCLDPRSVEKSISSKTKAVIFVGIGGNAQNYREIHEICKKYGLVFILDAAHMSGTRWKLSKQHVGLDSDCAIFSYQAVKNCPSGDAGMICFLDADLDERARKLSWLGIDKSTFNRFTESSYKWKYDVTDIGFKYHGNSIMASLCRVSLKYLDEDNQYRRDLAASYIEALSQYNNLKIVHHSEEIISSRHTFQILVENRDNLIDKLSSHSIYCGVHYLINSKFNIYQSFKSHAKKAEFYAERLISLPLHLDMTHQDIDRISELLK